MYFNISSIQLLHIIIYIQSNSPSLIFALSAAARFAGGVEGFSIAGPPRNIDSGPCFPAVIKPTLDGCIRGRDLYISIKNTCN